MQSNVQTKKKLSQAIQVMEAVTAENTNLKVQLQMKEDLVTALKLKLDDSSNTSVETTELHDKGMKGRMKSAVLATLPLKIES